MTAARQGRAAPRDCPVCGHGLALTRLSCPDCDTELSGNFEACDFCALSPEDRQTLRVFLASRGNMKDLERHLGVSYPTARARFDAVLARLRIEATTAPAPSRVELMEKVARGEMSVDDALQKLG
jgi:hypothetical protein